MPLLKSGLYISQSNYPTSERHITQIRHWIYANSATFERIFKGIFKYIENSSKLLLSWRLWQFEIDQNSLLKMEIFKIYLLISQNDYSLFLRLFLVNLSYNMLQFPYQPTCILFLEMLDFLKVVLQWCGLRRNESNFQSVNPIRRNSKEIWKFDWFLLNLHHCNSTPEESSLQIMNENWLILYLSRKNSLLYLGMTPFMMIPKHLHITHWWYISWWSSLCLHRSLISLLYSYI